MRVRYDDPLLAREHTYGITVVDGDPGTDGMPRWPAFLIAAASREDMCFASHDGHPLAWLAFCAWIGSDGTPFQVMRGVLSVLKKRST